MRAGRRVSGRARVLAGDLAVAARTTSTVLRARGVLARGGLPAALGVFGLRAVGVGHDALTGGAWDPRSRRRARVAGRVLRLPGIRTTCLPTALTLAEVLRRGGVPVDVVIGVSAATGFSAHAWVELADGRIDLAGHPLSAHQEISRLRSVVDGR